MAHKYYISNGDKFLTAGKGTGYSFVQGSIANVLHFKYSEGNAYIKENLKGNLEWNLQKLFKDAKSGKRYAITNATMFVENNGRLTRCFENARAFRSAADAENYIKNHPELKKQFVKPIIWDDQFNSIDMNAHKEFTKEQLQKLGKQTNNVSRRINFSPDKKKLVYDRDGGKCALCGRPLVFEEATLDHIVPISRGGANEIDNLRITCSSCNNMKGQLYDNEMKKSMTMIFAKLLYENPLTDETNMIIRAIVRGTLKDMGVNFNEQ